MNVSTNSGIDGGGATTVLSGPSIGVVSLVDQTDNIDIVRARSRRRCSGRGCVLVIGEKNLSTICRKLRFCLFVVDECMTPSSIDGVNI